MSNLDKLWIQIINKKKKPSLQKKIQIFTTSDNELTST